MRAKATDSPTNSVSNKSLQERHTHLQGLVTKFSIATGELAKTERSTEYLGQCTGTLGHTYMSADKNNSVIDSIEGEVKWFDARKGFGFIVGPDQQDIFVHFSVINQESGFRTLKDGESVIYSAEEGSKGWSATQVRATARVTAEEAEHSAS